MTSLDFLYICLGLGFSVLIIFLCVLIMHVVLLLRDVHKITDDLQNTSGRLKEFVFEPMESLAKVSGIFAIIHDLSERLKNKYQEKMAERDAEKEADEEL